MAGIQKILRFAQGFITIVFFYVAGELIRRLTGIPIPGAILGMVFLFLALTFTAGWIPAATLEVAQRLISLLALLLLPPSVGIFFLPEEFQSQLPAIVGAIVFGTLLSMVITGWLMTRLLPDDSGSAEDAQ